MGWKTPPPRCSLACNGEIVRYYRSLRGWTQGQLASVAGYSERVIRKAEAGEPLHADTIEVLAEALSAPEEVVHPEDLASVPKAIARYLVESHRKHQRQLVAAVHHVLDEEMRAWLAGDPNEIPYAGEWRTIDGFDRFNQVLEDYFELLDTHADAYIAEGKHVFVPARYAVRAKATGEVQTIRSVNEVVVERGKIVSFKNHVDTLNLANVMRRIRGKSADGNTANGAKSAEARERKDQAG